MGIGNSDLSQAAPSSLPAINAQLCNSQVKFSLDFASAFYNETYGKQAQDQLKAKNSLVYSPLSIYMALAMTSLGSTGDTRKELLGKLFQQVDANENHHQHMKLLYQVMG